VHESSETSVPNDQNRLSLEGEYNGKASENRHFSGIRSGYLFSV
jgi:hypothetical protein